MREPRRQNRRALRTFDPMRLLVPVAALALILGFLLGGRVSRLEHLRLRWWGVVAAGLAVQFVPLPEGGDGSELFVRSAALALSYWLLLLFSAVNLRLPGMPLVLAGLACNAVVIVANGGMPVSESALRASDQAEVIRTLAEQGADKHHLLDDGDVLTFLADVIAVPSPIAQVISIGDVLVYGGLVWLVVAAMRERTLAVRPTGPAAYHGKHRPGEAPTSPVLLLPPPPPAPPPAATRSGTEP